MKNMCILEGSAVTFSGVVGKGVTVCIELELEDDGLEKLQELYDAPFFHLS